VLWTIARVKLQASQPIRFVRLLAISRLSPPAPTGSSQVEIEADADPDTLTHQLKQVWVFRAIGKTHQEIAEQLGWSVSTVKRRLAEAKRRKITGIAKLNALEKLGDLVWTLAHSKAEALKSMYRCRSVGDEAGVNALLRTLIAINGDQADLFERMGLFEAYRADAADRKRRDLTRDENSASHLKEMTHICLEHQAKLNLALTELTNKISAALPADLQGIDLQALFDAAAEKVSAALSEIDFNRGGDHALKPEDTPGEDIFGM
jgi:DNA-binding Lrp family transcriptional regulator